MTLVKCIRIPGKPKHRIETCWERKEKAKAEAERLKPINAKARKGGTGVTIMDQGLTFCLDCDPTGMKTIEFDAGTISAPILQKKCKKPVLIQPKQQSKEKEDTVEKKFACKACKTETDNPDAFIHKQNICRKCYMKEYYKRHPKKSGSTLAPRMSRQEEDIVDVILKGGAKIAVPKRAAKGKGLEKQIDFGKPKKVEVKAEEKVLDVPVEKLTLRDIVEAGGEVAIGEAKDVPKCKTCGTRCTETETFNMEKCLCGGCLLNKEHIDQLTKAHKEREEWREGIVQFFGPTDEQVVVDFARHPELLDFLKEMAGEDFRPVEMEILAILDHLKQTREKIQEG